jgi:CO dehydrogenase/acetyl-CoA synthase beta subunit
MQLEPRDWETLASKLPKHAREQRREASIKAAHERLEAMRAARIERVKQQKKCDTDPSFYSYCSLCQAFGTSCCVTDHAHDDW